MTRMLMVFLSVTTSVLLLYALRFLPQSWKLPDPEKWPDEERNLPKRIRRIHRATTTIFVIVCGCIALQFCQFMWTLMNQPGTALDTIEWRWISWMIDIACLIPLGLIWTIRLDAKSVTDDAEAVGIPKKKKNLALITVNDVITLAAQNGGWMGRPPAQMYDEHNRRLFH